MGCASTPEQKGSSRPAGARASSPGYGTVVKLGRAAGLRVLTSQARISIAPLSLMVMTIRSSATAVWMIVAPAGGMKHFFADAGVGPG